MSADQIVTGIVIGALWLCAALVLGGVIVAQRLNSALDRSIRADRAREALAKKGQEPPEGRDPDTVERWLDL